MCILLQVHLKVYTDVVTSASYLFQQLLLYSQTPTGQGTSSVQVRRVHRDHGPGSLSRRYFSLVFVLVRYMATKNIHDGVDLEEATSAEEGEDLICGVMQRDFNPVFALMIYLSYI